MTFKSQIKRYKTQDTGIAPKLVGNCYESHEFVSQSHASQNVARHRFWFCRLDRYCRSNCSRL
ncbi:hypothetical protein [Moraxella lacunata]|uniref:hypothetical protein n=1 Tax=Moraxella lacunata TaxID=477 RepID=UPI003EE357C8